MVTKEMSPIFNTIPEFNTFETLLDLMVNLNKIMTKLNKIFTVQSIYGTSLFNIFELNLASNVFISTPQLLRTNVNFHRVIKTKMPTFIKSPYLINTMNL